jgi:hypothetical protein
MLAEASRQLELAQQQPTPTPKSGVGVLAVTLTPGFVRESSDWKKISLTPDKKTVSFRLDLPEDKYVSYQAALQTLEEQNKLTRSGLKARANLVLFDVLANILTPGDYRIVLSGKNSSGTSNEIGSYYFRILR